MAFVKLNELSQQPYTGVIFTFHYCKPIPHISFSKNYTHLWLYGWWDLPWIIGNSFHIIFSSVITAAVSSAPFSLWRLYRKHNSRKISICWYAASAACLHDSDHWIQNLVKCSWYSMIYLHKSWATDSIQTLVVWKFTHIKMTAQDSYINLPHNRNPRQGNSQNEKVFEIILD